MKDETSELLMNDRDGRPLASLSLAVGGYMPHLCVLTVKGRGKSKEYAGVALTLEEVRWLAKKLNAWIKESGTTKAP